MLIRNYPENLSNDSPVTSNWQWLIQYQLIAFIFKPFTYFSLLPVMISCDTMAKDRCEFAAVVDDSLAPFHRKFGFTPTSLRMRTTRREGSQKQLNDTWRTSSTGVEIMTEPVWRVNRLYLKPKQLISSSVAENRMTKTWVIMQMLKKKGGFWPYCVLLNEQMSN